MKLSLQKSIKNNLVLKCMALLLGFFAWFIVSRLHKTTVWVEVPLSFYNNHDHVVINAPESLHVQLSGYRDVIRSIDHDSLAVHIDIHDLNEGKNPIRVHAQNLFLPDLISVVNYSPLNGYIEKITH